MAPISKSLGANERDRRTARIEPNGQTRPEKLDLKASQSLRAAPDFDPTDRRTGPYQPRLRSRETY
ncbi:MULTISPECIES: hypothetical protein [Ferrimicrobium]|uniref:hypothetical protein n=1 Tax=Ferrimicrobium TaxID=121038 RepID=UPI0026233F02|nr:hypothetical protein [Ferrimicrobium sp.]